MINYIQFFIQVSKLKTRLISFQLKVTLSLTFPQPWLNASSMFYIPKMRKFLSDGAAEKWRRAARTKQPKVSSLHIKRERIEKEDKKIGWDMKGKNYLRFNCFGRRPLKLIRKISHPWVGWRVNERVCGGDSFSFEPSRQFLSPSAFLCNYTLAILS